jgi:hypothetical protein
MLIVHHNARCPRFVPLTRDDSGTQHGVVAQVIVSAVAPNLVCFNDHHADVFSHHGQCQISYVPVPIFARSLARHTGEQLVTALLDEGENMRFQFILSGKKLPLRGDHCLKVLENQASCLRDRSDRAWSVVLGYSVLVLAERTNHSGDMEATIAISLDWEHSSLWHSNCTNWENRN